MKTVFARCRSFHTASTPWPRLALAALLLLGTASSFPAWAEDSAMPVTGSMRVLLDHPVSYPGDRAEIRIQAAREAVPGDTLVFNCVADLKDAHDGCLLVLEIFDTEGQVLHEGSIGMDAHQGENPARFMWMPPALDPGRYPVKVSLQHDPTGVLARFGLELVFLSEEVLQAEIEYVHNEIDILNGHIEHTMPETEPILAEKRLTICSDALPHAQAALESGDWLAAERLIDYLVHMVDSVRAGLAFGGPETLPSPQTVGRKDVLTLVPGGFAQNNAPVFLVGGHVASEQEIAICAQYGLNLAAIDAGPGADLSTVTTLARAAESANIPLLAQFLPQTTLLASPWEALSGVPADGVNLGGKLSQQAFTDHSEAVLQTLSGLDSLVLVELVEGMRFQFGGDEVRLRFADHLQNQYGDINTINETWRSRLTRFQDIGLPTNSPLTPLEPEPQYFQKPSYQYDWQSFHESVAEDWVGQIIGRYKAQSGAGKLYGATFPDSALLQGQSWNGISHETMAGILEVVGVASPEAALARDLRISYPQGIIDLDLLRSIAPETPLMVSAMPLDPFEEDPVRSSAILYSRLIHTTVAGADAIALAPSRTDANGTLMPWETDALALARFDLNRLAHEFSALQQASPDVGIVWSESSRIFQNGAPYLESALNAYEGVSYFGCNFRFISEAQIAAGELENLSVVVLPDTLSMPDTAFNQLQAYVEAGGLIIRGGRPVPYDERGMSRREVLEHTLRTFLIRGGGTPADYLDALDAAWHETGTDIGLRPVNAYEYPIEKVLCRTAVHEGADLVYILSLREATEQVHLACGPRTGEDLLSGRPVSFPMMLEPSSPMLIRLDSTAELPELAVAEEPGIPVAEVLPVQAIPPAPPRPFRVPEKRKGIRPKYPPLEQPSPVVLPERPRLHE